MTQLPLDAELLVEPSKVTDYLLSLEHQVGKAKAKFFLGNGFTISDPEQFSEALKTHARTRPIVSINEGPFGNKISVSCELDFPDEKARCIRTVWIETSPNSYRLVTSYPDK